ncbi:MAG: histidine kinase [Candidatus Aminicenantes bacterium RBG_19FT_COMBO_58_17]|jgi:PAS domain S-box-containing protein/putative nucleotidyltransferase with HDIG domain|nr:MAG: histidine kinase [Candidatus Aminicenantes bacterium RBG_19FT_COMBO_58_17]
MDKIRILIVEDESLVARDIENMAVSQGYEVCGIASTGDQSIEMAAQFQPDLVLMDVIIKGSLDGISTAEKIWDSYRIPIIYVTAYADEHTLKRAKITEAFGYILKPFDERELKIAIEMAYYKSRMGTKLREREEWLSALLKSIGDGVIATDKSGTITFMNPLAERLTAWHQEEALRQPLREVFRTVVSRDGDEPEIVLWARNGKKFSIEETNMPMSDGRNNSSGHVLVFRDISARKSAEKELKESWEKLHEALEGTIQAMALTIEIRDPYTAGHQRRVSKLSCAIAQDLGMSEFEVEGLRVAGDIHDIGKIYVPAEILSKPGQITAIEYGIIKTHPQVGYDILKTIKFPWPVAEIVLQHHERLDGSGYPLGLVAEHILKQARILTVSDIVEAMSSHRPYRPAQGIDKALAEVVQNKGRFYDTDAVDACVKLFQENRFHFTEEVRA